MRLDHRSETAFIADSRRQAAGIDELLERLEGFSAATQRFTERRSADRHNHEFLQVEVVVGMRAAIDDVHHRNGQRYGPHAAEVAVERQTGFLSGSARHGHGDCEHRIGAETALVFRAVQINHQAVNVDLIGRFCAEHGIGDFARNVFHGLENALAAETSRILVAEFNRFTHAGRSARGNRRRCDNAAFKPNFRFNGRIAAAVENLTADDIDNGAHVCASQIYLRVEMMVCLTALFSPSGLG